MTYTEECLESLQKLQQMYEKRTRASRPSDFGHDRRLFYFKNVCIIVGDVVRDAELSAAATAASRKRPSPDTSVAGSPAKTRRQSLSSELAEKLDASMAFG